MARCQCGALMIPKAKNFWQQQRIQNMYLCSNTSNSNPEGVSEHILYKYFAPGPRFGALGISYKKDQRLSMQKSVRQRRYCCVDKRELTWVIVETSVLAKNASKHSKTGAG